MSHLLRRTLSSLARVSGGGQVVGTRSSGWAAVTCNDAPSVTNLLFPNLTPVGR